MKQALKTVTAPEEKRKIIGDTFMRVAEAALRDLHLQPEDVYLAQGTLRPDLIESASSLARCACVCMCVHVCACVCMCVHVCACA
jgi:GMP synthase (glutamine-hydrolysing)